MHYFLEVYCSLVYNDCDQFTNIVILLLFFISNLCCNDFDSAHIVVVKNKMAVLVKVNFKANGRF